MPGFFITGNQNTKMKVSAYPGFFRKIKAPECNDERNSDKKG